MLLKELVEVLAIEEVDGNLELDITGIAYDSRQVKPGDVFVAIDGFQYDGHEFISDAVENGAVAVIIEKSPMVKSGVATVRTSNSRTALAKISHKFYDYPTNELKIIGVTGTNGKTTTTFLIERVLNKLGNETGLIGTIKNRIGDIEEEASRTTPESLDLQQLFKRMLTKGVQYVAMEVSSHALQLNRVLGINFTRQVFTNLSQDHLDFHSSFEQYLKIKTKLFKLNDQPSIINIDDKSGMEIKNQSQGEVITYGLSSGADFKAEEINVSLNGTSYLLKFEDASYQIDLNLAGKFNVYNSLAAIATLYSFGFDLEAVAVAFKKIKGVPGRFELIKEGQDFGVIVDYAHTPDGMENVLKTAAEITTARTIVVFGCGGDRDTKKRPMMGKLGVELADFAIVTSDNPRSEDPKKIIDQIKVGIEESGKVEGQDYIVIQNRGEAIKKAIAMAEADDLVMIIGKGHETYQILNDKTVDFDDRKQARMALQKRSEN